MPSLPNFAMETSAPGVMEPMALSSPGPLRMISRRAWRQPREAQLPLSFHPFLSFLKRDLSGGCLEYQWSFPGEAL